MQIHRSPPLDATNTGVIVPLHCGNFRKGTEGEGEGVVLLGRESQRTILYTITVNNHIMPLVLIALPLRHLVAVICGQLGPIFLVM